VPHPGSRPAWGCSRSGTLRACRPSRDQAHGRARPGCRCTARGSRAPCDRRQRRPARNWRPRASLAARAALARDRDRPAIPGRGVLRAPCHGKLLGRRRRGGLWRQLR
jgi:hypothetical protein